ncbi:wall-associated receptor kinase 3-like [Panicum hallii]|jgi:hypothetical protein|uniref:wall-associated receptor kinase 3-like n=1 Tax=Panicum hallii TaxID=206008 RepID=UPI000DF4E83D|nr:wall-associated receptor kinase 3-like [Panicum hallii]
MRAFTVSVTRPQLVLATAVAALVSSSQLLLLAAAADQIGRPGCPTVCGDVSVPYPFGISPECSLPGFILTCDTSRTPPRLSLGGDGTLQVTNISLDSATVRVSGPAIHISVPRTIITTAGNGTWGGPAWGLSDGGSNILSAASNELIITGCNLFVGLRVTGDVRVINSCGTLCGTVPPV